MTGKRMILIADDEKDQRARTRQVVEATGYALTEAKTWDEVVAWAEDERIKLILLDRFFRDFDVLAALSRLGGNAPIILITGKMDYRSDETLQKVCGAERIKKVLYKPFEGKDLLQPVQAILGQQPRPRDVRGALSNRYNRIYAIGDRATPTREPFICASNPLAEIYQQARAFAREDLPVLLSGATGTGKEILARMIHQQSPRQQKPFVTVNSAAIPETLLEAELFGYKRGAFTGAVSDRQGRFREAHEGTLFLDEIGDLGVGLQAKVLRALQEGEIQPLGGDIAKVDVRVIAATHYDLRRRMAAGCFREDLYYRVAAADLKLPPLTARGQDLDLLVEHFIRRFARQPDAVGLSEEALALLRGYTWPGNVRELENTVQRALALVSMHGLLLTPAHLPVHIVRYPEPGATTGEAIQSRLEEILAAIAVEDIDRKTITHYQEEVALALLDRVYHHQRGNLAAVTRQLGLGKKTLYTRTWKQRLAKVQQRE